MKYVLGLDIGIASVGWAVLSLDKKRIEDLGVRAFNAAENPKDQSPLAEPRRIARCTRRRLHRRANRLQKAKALFVQSGLIAQTQRESAFLASSEKPSPWQLRAEGLDRAFSGEEFARALFHIVKFRGFKSNSKKLKKKEDGEMLDGIAGNRRMLEEHGYRTTGEMFHCDPKFRDRKHNTTGSYEHCVSRELLELEIRLLFERQRLTGNALATPVLEQAYLEIFAWQKAFASGEEILEKVGPCTFEKGEKRAARHAYSVERFNLLQKINSLTYLLDGDRQRLTDDQRQQVEKLAYQKDKVTHKQIRKQLNLPEEARFAGLLYLRKKDKGSDLEESLKCEDSIFFAMNGFHALRKACEKVGVWAEVKEQPELMDDLLHALTFYKTDEDIQKYLAEHAISETIIAAALDCEEELTKTSHLSLAAIRKLLPHLEKGLLYSEACAAAGYDHSQPTSGKRLEKLPPIPPEVTNNPVVRRALAQARKVVNAVITRYGSPYRVHIELARDIGKSREQRRETKKWQDENAAQRKALQEQLEQDFHCSRTGGNELKLRLYREQAGKCAYSLQTIDPARLFEPGYTEIDHIIPYSRSHEDKRSNRVLVLSSENQKKRDSIPYEYFGSNEKRWNEFEAWVKAFIKDPKKRSNLFRTHFDEKNEREWKDRNLNDTRYIAREFSHYVRENLKFSDSQNKMPVLCVNGQMVARVRGFWGIHKVREENDLHHAADAAVVATLLPHQIKLITKHAKVEETAESYVDEETGEIIEPTRPRLPQPWKGFRKELVARLSDDPAQQIQQLSLDSYADKTDLRLVLVSRMPQRKVSGAIHEETIRSSKHLADQGVSVIRRSVTSLSETDLKNLFAPETNERLYTEIRQRMAAHNNDAKKAFAEPLRKPTNDGSPGPIVKSVKVCQKQDSGVSVRGGIAANADMVRTDVFRKDGKYYLVPVYVAEFMAGKLPNRAIVAYKPCEKWPVMDDSYGFLFSLHPYDLIRIDSGKDSFFGYYKGSHRGTGALLICEPNNIQKEKGLGARLAKSIAKFEMGVLGDYYPVRKEVRRGLENHRHLQTGEVES